MRGLGALAISALARVEVAAALWRKVRDGELAPVLAERLRRAFAIDVLGRAGEPPRFAVVATNAATLERATLALAEHPLRAADAVQLASALIARDADPGCTTFACFDRGLRDAAAASGFRLAP